MRMKIEVHAMSYAYNRWGLHWSRQAVTKKLVMVWLDVGKICLWVIIKSGGNENVY